jgi:hypothetical protein
MTIEKEIGIDEVVLAAVNLDVEELNRPASLEATF